MTTSQIPCPACGSLQNRAQPVCDDCGIELESPAEEPVAKRRRKTSEDDTQVLELPPELKASTHHVTRTTANLRLASGVVSSAGILRRAEPDEDSVLVLEFGRVLEGQQQWLGFYSVADGMGGQEAGEVASRLALESLSLSVIELFALPWLQHESMSPDIIHERLSRCVEAAHQRVKRGNQEADRDMGTTVTAALVLDGHVHVFNVGDSRVYVYRASKDELRRLSRDQSLVQQLVEAGEITEDEVYSDPRRNIILSSLGGDTLESGAEFFHDTLEAGDKLLVCSDGLWEMIRDQDLLKVIDLKVDPQTCAEDLVTLACINGGADNVSAIVVEHQLRKRL